MADIELISTKTCPYVQRSRIALMEKEVDFVFTEVDLRNKPDWFLSISPYGKVPVLKHNDKVIYESAVINEYLEEVFPKPSLMPKDPVDRAFARIWIDYCNSQSMTANRSLLMCQDSSEQGTLRENLADNLLFIENEGLAKTSGSGPFWFGSSITLTDITFLPLFQRLCATEHYRGFKIPDECERIRALIEAMRSRTSVNETSLPDDVLIKHYVRYAEPSKAA